MKQTGSPRLCASPRLVSTKVRATHSCCQDTGPHCAAWPRGTMRACFPPERSTVPLSTTPQQGPREPSGLGERVRGTPLGPCSGGNHQGGTAVHSALWSKARESGFVLVLCWGINHRAKGQDRSYTGGCRAACPPLLQLSCPAQEATGPAESQRTVSMPHPTRLSQSVNMSFGSVETAAGLPLDPPQMPMTLLSPDPLFLF